MSQSTAIRTESSFNARQRKYLLAFFGPRLELDNEITPRIATRPLFC